MVGITDTGVSGLKPSSQNAKNLRRDQRRREEGVGVGEGGGEEREEREGGRKKNEFHWLVAAAAEDADTLGSAPFPGPALRFPAPPAQPQMNTQNMRTRT